MLAAVVGVVGNQLLGSGPWTWLAFVVMVVLGAAATTWLAWSTGAAEDPGPLVTNRTGDVTADGDGQAIGINHGHVTRGNHV